MIALASARNVGGNKVAFVTAPIQDISFPNDFDVVITPFLLDNFSEETLKVIFLKIDTSLATKGLWLFCDFQNTAIWWQRTVLKIMYLFFRTFCGVEAEKLPHINEAFEQNSYTIKEEKAFISGFVMARVYEKISHSL